MRYGTSSLYGCFKLVAVTIANLAWAQWLIHLNDLIACTQNGYSRTEHNRNSDPAQRCQYADLPRADLTTTR